MSENRVHITFLGRIIGTATGWDQFDTFAIQVYDFEPIKDSEDPMIQKFEPCALLVLDPFVASTAWNHFSMDYAYSLNSEGLKDKVFLAEA